MAKIYNKGKRKFTFAKSFDEKGHPVVDDKGKPIEQSLEAGKTAIVDDAVAKDLVTRFSRELVDLESVGSMQAQFQDTPDAVPHPRYLSPEEVDEKIKKAVALAVGGKNEPNKPIDVSNLDRSELIALIEEKKLDIDASKLKNPDALKKAVSEALAA